MDQERDQVREVELARERVAQDVRNVAENANVVQRTKENVQGRIDDAKDAVGDRVSDVRDKLSDARDSLASNLGSMRRNIGNVNPLENPVAMLIGGLAIGFLIGMVLPVTQFESERIGPITDDMKDRVRQAGSEVVRRGSEVIKETIEASREAATNSLREQTRDFTDLGGDNPTA
ncbi:MAG TPA: hypothetical protein VFL13_13520 [Candidatus Baltobacteraceae bacterium]|nr:hypothetical protein [Candidatus Baltobacteraceae bacterium]